MKILFLMLGVLLLASTFTYFYIFREQEIDLEFVPDYFEYCSRTITKNDHDYQKIIALLRENQDGWTQSSATYAPKQTYKHDDFIITVLQDAIVVSYNTSHGAKQLVKTINHGLANDCN